MTIRYKPVQAFKNLARSAPASVNVELRDFGNGTHGEVIAEQTLILQQPKVLAVGVASAQSAVVGTNTNRIVLSATSACWVSIGENPTATVATTGSFYLAAGSQSYPISVTAGVTKIAVIQDTAAGYLSIIEST